MYDEETRHLLKQQAAIEAEVVYKRFDPLTGQSYMEEDHDSSNDADPRL